MSSYHAPLVVMLRTKIVANGQRVYSDWSTWELPAGASVDLELSIATAFQLLGDTPDYPASVVIEGRTLRDDGDQFRGFRISSGRLRAEMTA